MLKQVLRHRDNIVIQFSVASFVVMVLLAATIAIIFTNQLTENIGLLAMHGSQMHAGHIIRPSDPFSIPSLTEDVGKLRQLTFLIIGSGFALLYVSLVAIVWNAWKTIKSQRSALYERVQQLEDASAEISQLQGMLPLCSHCKNVRDDRGYWRKIETYLSKQMEATFSHSICPACLETHYPKLADRVAANMPPTESVRSPSA